MDLHKVQKSKSIHQNVCMFCLFSGSIAIKSLDIQLDIDKLDHHNHCYYVFCLIYVRDTIVKTPVVRLDYARYNPEAKTFNIQKNITIKNIYSDFDAKIHIFGLKTPKVSRIETPSKKMKLVPKHKKTGNTTSGPDQWVLSYFPFEFI